MVLENIFADFWIITETHCRDNENIDLESYEVFHNNRIVLNSNRKGSGGIAIAINKSVLETHSIENIFKEFDGQIGVKLKNKINEFSVGIFGGYLPPDSYVYGQDNEGFFNNAAVIWENLSDCDLLIGAGDLNARTKDLLDYLPEVDGHIAPRTNPDHSKNSHGDAFITFLKDNRAVILNGRITPQLNNFTFISGRGSSVPDYQFCPLDQLNYCSKMETLLIRDIINDMQVPPPPSIPDHSILRGTFTTSYFKFGQQYNCSFEPFNDTLNNKISNPPKKNLKRVNDQFFMSEEISNSIRETICRIEAGIKNQSEVDMLWSEIKSLFITEMEQLPNLPQPQNKSLKKTFRKCQPFWNPELANLWFSTCQAEKRYLEFKVYSVRDLPQKII